jgi:phosphoribosylamine--glycine ligase
MNALGQRLDIEATDIQGLLLFARREKIDLTIVGPEAPLALGITDAFQKEGLLIFGPTQAGAQMEASKSFAKTIMAEAQVPTAPYRLCQTRQEAEAALTTFQPPYVIKQDGLAAGKGVVIAETLAEAQQALDQAFESNQPVLLEAFIRGQEISVLALCDGKRALPLLPAQDHKRVGEGDTGPNTGGMGAYAPVPWVTPTLMHRVQAEVLDPVIQMLQRKGIDYRGVLYAGLMIGEEGTPYVIEFNARFGDPETQVVLPLMESDLLTVLMAAARGDLSEYEATGIRFQPNRSALTVVLASGGYPGSFQKGLPITLPETLPPHTLLFHAGTAVNALVGGGTTLLTSGGRVLNAVGLGGSLEVAQTKAYTLANQVHFEHGFFRKDIGQKALALLKP